jgi:hypothetical protein
MVRAVVHFYVGEFLLGFVQAVVGFLSASPCVETWAPPSCRREWSCRPILSAPDRLAAVNSSFNCNSRADTMFVFLRADDLHLALELQQRRARPLHLGSQLFELLLHELGKPGGGAVPDRVSVLQIRLRDPVGYVGGQALVGRLVADQENVRIVRPGHFQLLQDDGYIFDFGVLDAPLVPIVVLQLAQFCISTHTGRRTASAWISLI